MITETATVIGVNEDHITLEAAIKSTCSTCHAQSDCGSGVISRAIAPKLQHITVQSPMTVRVGDKVQVGIPEAGLLGASMWLYMAPLVVLLLSAGTLHTLTSHMQAMGELITVAGSVTATLIGFVAISRHLKQVDQQQFKPVLLSVIKP